MPGMDFLGSQAGAQSSPAQQIIASLIGQQAGGPVQTDPQQIFSVLRNQLSNSGAALSPEEMQLIQQQLPNLIRQQATQAGARLSPAEVQAIQRLIPNANSSVGQFRSQLQQFGL